MKRLAFAAAVAFALGLTAWWWGGGAEAPAAARDGDAAQRLEARPAAAGGGRSTSATHRTAAEAGDPFLAPGLRFALEAMLLEAGRADSPAALKQRLAQLAPQHFPAHLAARALALAERYVDYRVALADLATPSDARDPRLMRSAFEARERLRERHFAPEEREALFAAEAALDRFTLARLEIERNDQLTPAQKQAALREAENDFPSAEREQRVVAIAHLAVATQTAAYDAQGATDAQRLAERSLLHGEAAAARLAQLDQEERDWQQRLAHYAQAQSGPSDAVAHLRDQLFTPAEQLRLEAALALRARAAGAPR